MVMIVTVLKEGKDFNANHVRWLHNQLPATVPSICLSDVEVPTIRTISLIGKWPGWWSKIEVFNPYLPIIGDEDLLYIDLDTVIVDDISPLLELREFTALTDFYREELPTAPMASAVMFIPKAIKPIIWAAWLANPEKHIRECCLPDKYGDQGFIGSVVDSLRWQDILPGAVISYKKDVVEEGRLLLSAGNGYVPEGTKLVCFHGNPRPWQTKENWVPPLNS